MAPDLGQRLPRRVRGVLAWCGADPVPQRHDGRHHSVAMGPPCRFPFSRPDCRRASAHDRGCETCRRWMGLVGCRRAENVSVTWSIRAMASSMTSSSAVKPVVSVSRMIAIARPRSAHSASVSGKISGGGTRRRIRNWPVRSRICAKRSFTTSIRASRSKRSRAAASSKGEPNRSFSGMRARVITSGGLDRPDASNDGRSLALERKRCVTRRRRWAPMRGDDRLVLAARPPSGRSPRPPATKSWDGSLRGAGRRCRRCTP